MQVALPGCVAYVVLLQIVHCDAPYAEYDPGGHNLGGSVPLHMLPAGQMEQVRLDCVDGVVGVHT